MTTIQNESLNKNQGSLRGRGDDATNCNKMCITKQESKNKCLTLFPAEGKFKTLNSDISNSESDPADKIKPNNTSVRKKLPDLIDREIRKAIEKNTEPLQRKRLVNDLSERRKIEDRYTIRYKNLNLDKEAVKSGQSNQDTKNEHSKKIDPNDMTSTKENSNPETESAKKEKNIREMKASTNTIMYLKEPLKVNKTVSFIDQKRKSMPLQVRIPNDELSKKARVECTETSPIKVETVKSRCSVKERKSRKLKHKKNPKHSLPQSPTGSSTSENRNNSSPPTEVAQWEPSSINAHTKPYYEAWVNTTLAAISRDAKEDELFLAKRKILQKFQKKLVEQCSSENLVYEKFSDERFTGKIKVSR